MEHIRKIYGRNETEGLSENPLTPALSPASGEREEFVHLFFWSYTKGLLPFRLWTSGSFSFGDDGSALGVLSRSPMVPKLF
jgi:hypothetical protein